MISGYGSSRRTTQGVGMYPAETAAASRPILDLNPVTGLLFEWLPEPADPERDEWGVINVMEPGFGRLPLHHHREAVETFAVESGVLEVWHRGKWHQVGPGES